MVVGDAPALPAKREREKSASDAAAATAADAPGAASEQPELSREEEALEMVRKHIAPIKREHRRRIEPREPKPPKAAEDPAPQDAAGGAEGAAAEGGGASKRQKKGKGQNKGRGDQKANLAARVQSALPHLCRKLVQEGACPFGDGCKFSHDVKAYLDKAAALAEPPGLECPSRKEGRPCRSRVMCRFAACRAEWAEKLLGAPDGGDRPGAGAGATGGTLGEGDAAGEQNALPRKLQAALREDQKGRGSIKWKRWKTELDKYKAALKAEKAGKDSGGVAAGEAAEGAALAAREDSGYRHGALLRAGEKRSLDLQGRTVLAPLTTVGNLPFRRLCKGFGVDVTLGEMALAGRIVEGNAGEWALFRRHSSEDTFGVQIAGGWPDQVAKCAELLEEHCAADFIDLNCGCPLDGVCSKGMGAELLDRTRRLQEIVTVASGSTSLPFTVKIRVGHFEDAARRHAHTLIPQLARWGAAAVTLHGRSRQQRYSREADWDYIRTCAAAGAAVGVPVLGNGDVLTWEDYHNRGTDVASCMVARGALIKPWIFTEIKERRYWDIRSSERLDMMRDFCRFGLDHWGSDSLGVEKTRTFLLEWQAWLCRYVPVGVLEVLPPRMNHRSPGFVARDDLEQLMASTQVEDWVKLSEMLLGPAPAGLDFVPKHRSSGKGSAESQAEG